MVPRSGPAALAADLMLAAAVPTWSQPAPTPTPQVGGLEQLARSKEAMVGRLLAQSILASRIRTADNPELLALLDQARQAFDNGRAHLADGNAGAANDAFDTALKAMHQARKGLAVDGANAVELNTRFNNLLKSIESLQGSYRSRRGAAGGKGSAPDEAFEAMVQRARRDAAEGRLEQAVDLLRETEAKLMTAIQTQIGSATLHYTEALDSPDQIFRHELSRNRGFAELVPLAIEQLNPPPAQRQALDEQLARNLALRQFAESEAAAQRFDSAITTLRQGTERIQALLERSGVSMSKAMKE